jgi:hypothetical protein
MKRIRILSIAAWLCGTLPAHAEFRVSPCEAAAAEAERAAGLPVGLLLAVGRVESGRWDAALQRVVPWPWAVDFGSAGRLLDSKREAVQAVQDASASGIRNIDVGCFQINLMHHPGAFASLDEAFDPPANAGYAARFLLSLRDRLGSWEEAVAAYHSADPSRGIPYRQLVMASWMDGGGRPAFRNVATSATTAFAFGIHVWVPTARNNAASAIVPVAADAAAVRGAPERLLPRVIVPSR